ncbi:MAG: hypothetical protein H6586_07880 [Flavobacteriales bacterium]|nr:hypothetical protein [Flavobacteriales bacterium]
MSLNKKILFDKDEYEITVELNPTKDRIMNSPSYLLYELVVDNKLEEDTSFKHFLFGNGHNQAAKEEFHKTALLIINGKEILIPYNILKSNHHESVLYNFFLSKEFIFPTEEAVVITAAYIFNTLVLNGKTPVIKEYVEYFTKGEEENFIQNLIKNIAYKMDKSKKSFDFWTDEE